ncbi:vWA domain-containing protein [Corynebacterium gerontici]|uniref:von Willebrand factor type A domain protein n=1 Tax=Corynebacterium gerontici TaxID=2079234 RepID=A0A3G6J8J6_9CORY|nr:vWA domain-containing protein [Corynebacterium gerontici]AZA12344.1 von Willebrand factor type A domain protein [Corynebacterium gerontici]
MQVTTEPASKKLGTIKTVLAFLAALAIAISTIAWIEPTPAHAQETETASETEDAGTSDGESATNDAAQQAVTEDASAASEEAAAPAEDQTTAEQTNNEAPAEQTATEEAPAESAEAEEATGIDVKGDPFRPTLTVSRRSSRAATAGADPRYQCGLDFALLIDTSLSTSDSAAKQRIKDAANQMIKNLANSGSSFTIIPFAKDATVALPRTSLDAAGVQQALNAVANLDQYWKEGGSNYAAAIDLAQSQGTNVSILVGDGRPIMANRTNGNLATKTFNEDLTNTYSAARNYQNSGGSIFSVWAQTDSTVQMFVPETNSRWSDYFLEEDYLPPAAFRSTNRAEMLRKQGTSWYSLSSSDVLVGVEGSRKVQHLNSLQDLAQKRYYRPREVLQNISVSVSDANRDLSDLTSEIDALTSGCWGTVNLQKEIVDSTGKVQSGQPLSGFEFVADKALNGSNVQSNFTVATDDQGKATLHYPTTAGVGAMKVTETQRDGFKLYEQTVNGNKTLAKCTAVDKNGSNVPIFYGSGSGIVVTSDKTNNAFSLSGVGEQHRVTCTVQNSKGEPKFALKKTPFGNGEARVITGEPNQTINVEYLIEVGNTGTSGGQPPIIREMPQAPAGTSVTNVVAFPEGSNPLVAQQITLTQGDGGAWTLYQQNLTAVDAGQKRTARVVVTYTVNDPNAVNEDDLTCEPGNTSKGLFNHAEFDQANDDTQKSDACVSATVPGVELKKRINDADANTKDGATAIMGGTDQVQITYEVKNSGSTPLTELRLDDFNLDQDSGAKQGPINMAGLVCEGASLRDEGTTKIITPTNPLAKDATLICRWTASAPIVPAEGEYHGDRGIVLASYNVPAEQGGQAKPVSSENDAWVFKLPIAVGVLPKSGGYGHNLYLMLGGFVAAAGAFWAYRRYA